MKVSRKTLSIGGLLFLTACATASDPASSWTRSYLATQDEVIDAVAEVLEDEDYLVDVDRPGGRILAHAVLHRKVALPGGSRYRDWTKSRRRSLRMFRAECI